MIIKSSGLHRSELQREFAKLNLRAVVQHGFRLIFRNEVRAEISIIFSIFHAKINERKSTMERNVVSSVYTF